MAYVPKIGLEIHAELKTKSKMFCGCANNPDEKTPNLNICPICLGNPGTLPVINKKAVELVIKTASALNCTIAKFSKFDRKNYFYPDLPKGYQVSQYDEPLSTKGYLEIAVDGEFQKIKIRRIHLEEDTGKLIHPEGADYSLIDFNRAGAPLMELVTEPDINSAAEAKKFCQELQLILKYLDVSGADMEKGQMRCEVNISIGKNGELGTKVEIKNLNSFKAVERSIDYEIKRQTGILENGEKIIQETRGWDENKGKSFSQRTKEEAHDYRYFPEPDLPPLDWKKPGGLSLIRIKSEVPELPSEKRIRFRKEYELPSKIADILISDKNFAEYFEEAVSELECWVKDKKLSLKSKEYLEMIKGTANYLIGDVQYLLSQKKIGISDIKITPENLAEFVCIVYEGRISSAVAKIVLEEMFNSGAEPSNIIAGKDLAQVSDESLLGKTVEEIIKNNPGPVGDYKSGKAQALQFLVGKVMAATKGKANPKIVTKILKEKLN